MVIAFFLFETFEQDMDTPVIPVTWYPTTFRRRRLDIAGKIVRTASRTVLKITATAESTVQFQQLWKRSVEIPPIQSCPAARETADEAACAVHSQPVEAHMVWQGDKSQPLIAPTARNRSVQVITIWVDSRFP